MGRFQRTVEVDVRIPTASMADIAFLLFIFFMVTTIFRAERGLDVTLPRATQGERLDRRHLAHVWIDRTGAISIDDALVSAEQVERILERKVREDDRLVVALNTDRDVPYRVLDEVLAALRSAAATHVAFNHDREEPIGLR